MSNYATSSGKHRYWWIADRLYHFSEYTPIDRDWLLGYASYFEVAAVNERDHQRFLSRHGDEGIPHKLKIADDLWELSQIIKSGQIHEAKALGCVLYERTRNLISKGLK